MSTRLRTAALLLAGLSLWSCALAAAAVHPRWVVNDWVTVGSDGKPSTQSPTIATKNDAVSTITGAPYLLTGTVFASTSNGQVATVTASPPPTTATASSGAGGYFAVCNNKIGDDSPFCQPRENSKLSINKTYYVTWAADYFASGDTMVHVSGIFTPSLIPVFPAISVPADRGYYAWTVQDAYLLGREEKDMTMTLTYTDADGEEKTLNGPKIWVVRADISINQPQESRSSGGVNPAAIAVPVVLGLAAVAAGLYFLWRRNKQKLILAGIRRRSSQGYGVGKSHSQRTRTGTDKSIADIQLHESPTSPTPSTPGRNVFQEELRRQERERG